MKTHASNVSTHRKTLILNAQADDRRVQRQLAKIDQSAIIAWPNGNLYSGEASDHGMRQGKGVQKYSDGYKYDG